LYDKITFAAYFEPREMHPLLQNFWMSGWAKMVWVCENEIFLFREMCGNEILCLGVVLGVMVDFVIFDRNFWKISFLPFWKIVE
jgi:hypothetical protein